MHEKEGEKCDATKKNRNMLIKAYALFSLRACLVLPVLSWIFEEE
jgi:hypothetical protein